MRLSMNHVCPIHICLPGMHFQEFEGSPASARLPHGKETPLGTLLGDPSDGHLRSTSRDSNIGNLMSYDGPR